MAYIILDPLQLIDANGLYLSAAPNVALVSGQQGFLGLAYDGTDVRYISCTAGGVLYVAQSGSWNVNQAGTWNVNAAQSGAWTVAATQSGAWSATVSGTVTANQGTPNSAANKWYVQNTDGTNVTPAMDAVTRPGFVSITDGTDGPVDVIPANSTPTTSSRAMTVVISPNQLAIPITSAPTGATTGISYGDLTSTSTTLQPVYRTNYTEQTANFTGSVVSSSANDTSAGTGAQKVTIYYVDQTGATAGTETVTLNGTTAVNLTINTKCFIEKMVVAQVGSGGVSAGIISLHTATAGGGTLVCSIAAGDPQTFLTHHYVVTGKTCHITSASVGSSSTVAGDGALYVARAKTLNLAGAVELQISDILTLYGQSSMVSRNYGTPVAVAGPARVLMYVAPLATTSNTYRGSFDYYDE